MSKFFPYRSRRRYASGGVNDDRTWWVKCEANGKCRDPETAPYLIANEWIAGKLAQFLLLPIPPFSVLAKRSPQTAMFCSYTFQGDSQPCDVKPDVLYELHPRACVGIVLFDIFVANCDRHRGNIKVDDPDSPRQFYIFDHERALFYIYPGEGITRLKSREKRLGVTDSADSRDEWHCLLELVDSIAAVKKWLTRIEDIPDWFIEGICSDIYAMKLGIDRKERDCVIEFLKARRDTLGTLLYDERDRFPRIPKADWGIFL